MAPFLRDSGPLKGRRAIWGGRAQGRAALYMAVGGYAEESGDSKLLSALVPGREGEEARLDGLHAEAAHDP